jgi:hypothetical protein
MTIDAADARAMTLTEAGNTTVVLADGTRAEEPGDVRDAVEAGHGGDWVTQDGWRIVATAGRALGGVRDTLEGYEFAFGVDEGWAVRVKRDG